MDWFEAAKELLAKWKAQGPTAGDSSTRFTPRSLQVLTLARKEAERLNHNFVGTEHVLVGLVGLGQGVAVNVLKNFGINLETVRNEVEKRVGVGPEQIKFDRIPYTPRMKKVLEVAKKQAAALDHT